MQLCLDVGNTHIFGGVFIDGVINFRFRYDTKQTHTSDQMGLFFRDVLLANGVDSKKVTDIAISSVVPGLNYTVRAACIKYFAIEPLFLQTGVKTGLKIKMKNPTDVGADLIAGAMGAVAAYPKHNLLIMDLGTATTVAVVNQDKEYLGTVIMPGIKTSMDALKNNTAQLPSVSIEKPDAVLGKSTRQSIQIGLYYTQYAALKELSSRIKQEYFANSSNIVVIGTGGFAGLFDQQFKLFDQINSDLVLEGLFTCLSKNRS